MNTGIGDLHLFLCHHLTDHCLSKSTSYTLEFVMLQMGETCSGIHRHLIHLVHPDVPQCLYEKHNTRLMLQWYLRVKQ